MRRAANRRKFSETSLTSARPRHGRASWIFFAELSVRRRGILAILDDRADHVREKLLHDSEADVGPRRDAEAYRGLTERFLAWWEPGSRQEGSGGHSAC